MVMHLDPLLIHVPISLVFPGYPNRLIIGGLS